MSSGLHCGLEPLTHPACPLTSWLSLTLSCYLPASPKLSNTRWHFVEHLVCVPWARPERAFCTCVRSGRRVPSLAPARLQSRTIHSPPRSKPPSRTGALQRRRQSSLGGTPASAAGSAVDGAAQATRARQLPRGTARAYPHARRHALVAATTPCRYSNGDSSSVLSPAAEPAPLRYKRRPRAPPST